MAPAAAAVEVGQRMPDFRLTNSSGEIVQLSDFAGRTVVLEWNNPGCPFVQRHYGSGNMQALQREARADGVVWLTINSGAPGRQGFMRGPAANGFVSRENASPSHYLLDPRGVVGRAYGATATPEMFVIDGSRVLRYNGAIDDAPRARESETRSANSYVRAALADLDAGRAVRTRETRPYGCSVKYSDAS
ncbi:MAG: redoxin domain-containing protein [Sphingomonadaceae bacterium]|nr:redoxin domain-containing protein [Sphingomonadaceae bacterium]